MKNNKNPGCYSQRNFSTSRQLKVIEEAEEDRIEKPEVANNFNLSTLNKNFKKILDLSASLQAWDYKKKEAQNSGLKYKDQYKSNESLQNFITETNQPEKPEHRRSIARCIPESWKIEYTQNSLNKSVFKSERTSFDMIKKVNLAKYSNN